MRDTKAYLYIKRKIDDIGEGRDFQEQGKKGKRSCARVEGLSFNRRDASSIATVYKVDAGAEDGIDNTENK